MPQIVQNSISSLVRPTQTDFGSGGWVLAHGQSLQPTTLIFVGDEVTSL
jgi:hypothetical protein